MRVTVIKQMRVGNRRHAVGDEIEVPDKLAKALIRTGHMRALETAPAAKASPAPADDEAPQKRTYKTRRLTAEDGAA